MKSMESVVAMDEIKRALCIPMNYINKSSMEISPRTHSYDIPIETIETHLSVVFRRCERVYKVKKTVDYGFVDFSTLEKRLHACLAEIRLNKRLAPGIYYGVAPIYMHQHTNTIVLVCDDYWNTQRTKDKEYWENNNYGVIIEWAVVMVRLPDQLSLQAQFTQNSLQRSWLKQLINELVTFHSRAQRTPEITAFGELNVIQRNMMENFEQTASHCGRLVSSEVYNAVKLLMINTFNSLKLIFQERVLQNKICDCHGDLRLEHIYIRSSGNQNWSTAHQPVDNDNIAFCIIDCIEFNDRFRYGDPISDVAFLFMDIWSQGKPALARYLLHQYGLALNYDQSKEDYQSLFIFYAAYRAIVRAKVCGLRVDDTSLSLDIQMKEAQRTAKYWMVANTLISNSAARPCLILIGGLPGSGKSTIAKLLMQDDRICQHPIVYLQSDAVRLHCMKKTMESEKYSTLATDNVYEMMKLEAQRHLKLGHRVIVDATFRNPKQRKSFLEMGIQEGVIICFIFCICDRECTQKRLEQRVKQKSPTEFSEATWDTYKLMEESWNLNTEELQNKVEILQLETKREPKESVTEILHFLHTMDVL